MFLVRINKNYKKFGFLFFFFLLYKVQNQELVSERLCDKLIINLIIVL